MYEHTCRCLVAKAGLCLRSPLSAQTFYYSLCSSQQYGEDLNIKKLWTNFLPESFIDGLNTCFDGVMFWFIEALGIVKH